MWWRMDAREEIPYQDHEVKDYEVLDGHIVVAIADFYDRFLPLAFATSLTITDHH